MSDIDDIEAKLKKVQQVKQIEHAIHLARMAIKHNSPIQKVCSEDAAECERSIVLDFTPEESAEIFKAVEKALEPRLKKFKADLGMAK